MKSSEKLDLVFASFAAAQAQMPNIIKSADVKVQTRTGGSYSFKYVPLDEAIETVKGIYADHDLAVSQMVGSDIGEDFTARTYIFTIVLHKSGQWFGDKVYIDDHLYKVDKVNGKVPVSAQEAGSAITYFKRYAYVSINGLSADEDDDGNAASGNKMERNTKGSAPKPQAKPTPKPQTKKEVDTPKAKEEPPFDPDDAGDASQSTNTGSDEIDFWAYETPKDVIMAYQSLLKANPTNRAEYEETVKPLMQKRLNELKG
jgi:hypothetical protein